MDTVSITQATQMWAPLIDVLARHHFNPHTDYPSCACGARVRNRHDFARHQVAQLAIDGALPTTTLTEWAVHYAGNQEPTVMPYDQALKESNRRGTDAQIVCRTTYPPGEWIEDLTRPSYQPR